MQFLADEIRQVTETVWDAVLGIILTPQETVPPMPARMVSGCVQFTGAWQGAVTIECSAEFARQAAATMFGMEPSEATISDTRDAIGELANMTGGNVKALLPGPSFLSLPTVMEGEDVTTHVHGGENITTVAFDCGGTPLIVRLHQKHETP